MDSLFYLDAEARRLFLRNAASTLGCAYVCLWYYVPHPSNYLISMDGWLQEDDMQPSASSGSYPRRLFEAYRSSCCFVETGSVPGLAFKRGLPYIELESSALVNLASVLAQRQFYREASIKTAVFMGCPSGEIELGMSSPNNTKMHENIQKLFGNDFMNYQNPFTEPLPIAWSRPSSSSSSFPSLSIESPEYSSFTDPPGENIIKATIPQSQQRTVDAYRYLLLPSHQNEDEVLTRAMLAVISSQPNDYQWRKEGTPKSQINSSAFKAYDSNTGASFDSKARFAGQKMLKKAITISRNIHFLNYRDGRGRGLRPANVQQLQHMMSERKRREKLGEGLHALRRLIPLGSKKDKLSVLLKAREYLETLKAQVHELQERNNKLELQLQPRKIGTAEKIHYSREMVEIQVNKASASTSKSVRINLVVMVRAQVNMVDLVLTVLECLKGMGISNLISVDASTCPPQESAVAWTNLTLQVEANDADENTLKEAVTQAIISLFAPPAA